MQGCLSTRGEGGRTHTAEPAWARTGAGSVEGSTSKQPLGRSACPGGTSGCSHNGAAAGEATTSQGFWQSKSSMARLAGPPRRRLTGVKAASAWALGHTSTEPPSATMAAPFRRSTVSSSNSNFMSDGGPLACRRRCGRQGRQRWRADRSGRRGGGRGASPGVLGTVSAGVTGLCSADRAARSQIQRQLGLRCSRKAGRSPCALALLPEG